MIFSYSLLPMVLMLASWTSSTKADHFCLTTRDRREVCANNKTYANRSVAICKGIKESEIEDGPCRLEPVLKPLDEEKQIGNPKACFTSRELNPVCYKGKTYSNPSMAECAGVNPSEMKSGPCELKIKECNYPEFYSPVCANNKEYENRYAARCDDVSESDIVNGRCEDPIQPSNSPSEEPFCTTTMEYAPVCAGNRNFPNRSVPKCVGFSDPEIINGLCETTGEPQEPVVALA